MPSATVILKDNSGVAIALERTAVRKALGKIGASAKAHAREIIIEKDIIDTGTLHDEMAYRTDADNAVVHIGSPQDYAIFNELGTVNMTARPFLSPAIMNNIDEYKEIVENELGNAFPVSGRGLTTRSEYYQDDERVTNI